MNIVVCHGNSITRGAFSSDDAVWAYPAQLQRLLDLYDPGNWTVHNEGTDGIQTPALTTEFAAVVDALAGASTNVVVVHEGTNHLKTGGVTPAQAFAAMQSYCETASGLGWIVYVCTGTTRDEAIAASIETYNVLLRAGYAAFADELIDLAIVPELTDPTDETYFHSDGTHFVDAGFTAIAEASFEPFMPGRLAQRDREIARYSQFLGGIMAGAIEATTLTESDVGGEIFLEWS